MPLDALHNPTNFGLLSAAPEVGGRKPGHWNRNHWPQFFARTCHGESSKNRRTRAGSLISSEGVWCSGRACLTHGGRCSATKPCSAG